MGHNHRDWKNEVPNVQEEMAKARAFNEQQTWAAQTQATLMQGPCRQSARGVLAERAQRLRAEAERLEALSRCLPMELPPEADEALWQLLTGNH